MKLESIEIAGFRGFREGVRFDFPEGFTVLSGHNGSGKSTVLDAIEFAITGSISKYSVKEAKGGGLLDHLWWVGDNKTHDNFVSISFLGQDGRRFKITRNRAGGCDTAPAEILKSLSCGRADSQHSLETLMQTTLIRDERIAALSLDLPEQARFATVRAAIGGLMGPDYSQRIAAISAAAETAKSRQSERVRSINDELGRALTALTEARSIAERSADISEALNLISSIESSLPVDIGERTETLRRLIAEKKVVLQELANARASAEELLPEISFLTSPVAREELDASRATLDSALQDKAHHEEAVATALRLQEAEKQADEYAMHLAAIVEHGSALGLQHGRCPLCYANRSEEEFENAIARAKQILAEQGKGLSEAKNSVTKAEASLATATASVNAARSRYQTLENRRGGIQQKLQRVQTVYRRHGFDARAEDPTAAKEKLFSQQEDLVRFERALSILENSNSVERVRALEQRINAFRELVDKETVTLSNAERAVELARQMKAAATTVQNQILTEEFDTVMPLLKELYRRLRPHTDWTEIESDFGGRVRASLNFTVGDGLNPQFLFSSGQRRATGLAFLLAIHMSRPWCTWRSLLLDDPVQHIDDYRALNLVEVLSAIRRTGRQIIVAVEDTSLADLLCRRLRSTPEQEGRHYELRTSSTGTAEIVNSRNIYPMPRLVLRPAKAS